MGKKKDVPVPPTPPEYMTPEEGKAFLDQWTADITRQRGEEDRRAKRDVNELVNRAFIQERNMARDADRAGIDLTKPNGKRRLFEFRRKAIKEKAVRNTISEKGTNAIRDREPSFQKEVDPDGKPLGRPDTALLYRAVHDMGMNDRYWTKARRPEDRKFKLTEACREVAKQTRTDRHLPSSGWHVTTVLMHVQLASEGPDAVGRSLKGLRYADYPVLDPE